MTNDNDARLARAQQAEAFLGEQLVKDIVLKEKDRLFTSWANSKPDEDAGREILYFEYRGLLRIINGLRAYVNDGKMIAERVKDAN